MIQNAFNSGEITPLLHGRPDVGVYSTGCRRLLNMRALIYGGVQRDPGSQHLGTAPGPARLIPFEFSSDQRFMVEFSDLAVRVWSTGEVPSVVDELVTPYAEGQLRQVHHAQINDLVIFTHPDHAPQLLTRTGPDTFTWATFPFLDPPFLDQNEDPEHTLSIEALDPGSAVAWSGSSVSYSVGSIVSYNGNTYAAGLAHISTAGNHPEAGTTYPTTRREFRSPQRGRGGYVFNYTKFLPVWKPLSDAPDIINIAPPGSSLDLVSTKEMFDAENIGEFLSLSFRRPLENRRVILPFPSNGNTSASDPIDVDGAFSISTSGNWNGLIEVQESVDLGATWNTILTYESAANANYNESNETTGDVLLRIQATSTGTAANSPKATLTSSDPFARSVVRIDVVTDATHATVTAIDPVRGTEVSFWNFAAFSVRQGFPAAVAFHRQRLFFGGTLQQPQKVWASALDQFDIFLRRELADEAADADQSFALNIVSNAQNRIAFLSSQKELVVGTSAGEWILAGDQQNGTLGPGSYQLIPLAHFGSDALQPIDAQIGLIFLQRGGRAVRHIGALTDILFSVPELEQLSLFGEHLIRPGVVEHAYQRSPQPIYWAVTADGRLVGHTHKPDQRVLAWHDHDLGQLARVESVASTFSEFEEDQVWIVVAHTQPDESIVRTVERFALGQAEAQESEDYAAFRYLHHHQTFTAEADTPITVETFDHILGRELVIYLDGQVLEKRPALESFEVTPPADGTLVIGCAYESLVETLPPVIQTPRGPTGFLTVTQIGRAYVLPYKAGPGRIRIHDDQPANWVFRSSATPLEDLPPLASDPVQVDGIGGYSDQSVVALATSEPFPFTIRAINYAVQATERL